MGDEEPNGSITVRCVGDGDGSFVETERDGGVVGESHPYCAKSSAAVARRRSVRSIVCGDMSLGLEPVSGECVGGETPRTGAGTAIIDVGEIVIAAPAGAPSASTNGVTCIGRARATRRVLRRCTGRMSSGGV